MTTIRLAKKKHFSVVPEEIYNNTKLSWEAKGFMCWILGQADNWEINVNHITKTFPQGKYKILHILNELKKAGYLFRYKKDFNSGWEYIVSETPMSEEEFKNFVRKNRFAIDSLYELFVKHPLINTNIDNNKEVINREDESYEQLNQDQGEDDLLDKKIEEVCKIVPSPFVLQHVEAMYEKYRDEIKYFDAWLKEVVKNAIQQEKRQTIDQEKFDQRRQWAYEMMENNPNNWFYDSSQDILAYFSGAQEWKYRIKQDLEFWKEHGL